MHGLDVLAGVIDCDFRGEVICIMINHGKSDFNVNQGDRIAQLIIECICMPEPKWSATDRTGRGTQGFGSSGI
jgi:dUTP pyrophosphatase